MTVSKLGQIDKAMPGAQRRTKADVALKLARGLPIASLDAGKVMLHQITADAGSKLSAVKVPTRLGRANLSQTSVARVKAYRRTRPQDGASAREKLG